MGSPLAVPVAALPLGAGGRSDGWPCGWREREPLLSRQRDRLAAVLAELIAVHGVGAPPWAAAEALAWDVCARRLIWDLRLHLRLEERWLTHSGCLCAGHRAAHADSLRSIQRGFALSSGDRPARARWLLDLQTWFQAHRSGPDATAYALAAKKP